MVRNETARKFTYGFSHIIQ